MARIVNDPSHACRDLHRIIARARGATLPIPISVVPIHVRKRRPLRRYNVCWPVLKMQSWLEYFLEHKSHLVLGGVHVDDAETWQSQLLDFWQLYQRIDPSHPIFASGYDLRGCLPYCIHGDEGRGFLKRPYMVIAFQMLLSPHGPEYCNSNMRLALVM